MILSPLRKSLRNPRLALGAFGATMLLGAASQALFGLAVARWFVPAEAGAYFIGLSITTLVGYASRIGTEQLALRDASPAWSDDDRRRYRAIAAMLRRVVLRSSAVAMTLTFAVTGAVAFIVRPAVLVESAEVWLAIALLLPMNLLTTGCALLRAADRMTSSIAMRYLAVFAPAFSLVGLGQATSATPSSPTLAVLLCTAVAVVTVWRKIFSLGEGSDELSFSSVRTAATRLTLATSLNAALTWGDRIILGVIAGAATVGVYGAASQLILPFNLIFLLGGTISSPAFSRLHARKDLAQLEATARSLSLAMLATAGLGALVILVAAPSVLRMLGEQYADATPIIAMLVVGRVINLGAGPIGLLFAMSKREDLLLRVTIGSAIISVIATVALTALYGAIGTALGVTIGLAAKNISLVLLARRHLGIAPVSVLPKMQDAPTSNPLMSLLR